MKILFIGDYGRVHSLLASTLRARGHQVDIISDSPDNGNIMLSHSAGFMGGMKYLYHLMQLLPRLAGYDVVHVDHPAYFNLKPGRLSYITRRLEESNGQLTLTALKPDFFYVDACRKGEMFRFSPFRIGKEKTPLTNCNPEIEYSQLGSELRDYVRWFHTRISNVMASTPEMQTILKAIRGCEIPALPIPQVVTTGNPTPRKGKVQLTVPGQLNDELIFGRDRLRHMAERLANEMPDKCVLVNGSLAETDSSCPVIMFDNANSYSPGIHALEAMAAGCVAVGGAQPEYAAFLGADEVPVVCASPFDDETTEEELRRLIASPVLLAEREEKSIEFMRRYHDVEVVATRFLNSICS